MPAQKTVQALSRQAEFYQRAAAFEGRPRERMVALGEADELFFRRFPHHYRALQVIRMAGQLGRTSAHRSLPLQGCESRTVALLTGVVTDALEQGDLSLAAPRRSDELAFSVWALVFGTRALMSTAVARVQLSVSDGHAVACDTADLLFDAMDWRPLSTEWNYADVRDRVRREVFADEWPGGSGVRASAGSFREAPVGEQVTGR